jgi:Zn-dependent peptidase ImmA (M78 family)
VGFRYGFKAEAERLALSLRRELGLSAYARLEPLRLAEHLAIPVVTLSTLATLSGNANDLEAAANLLRGTEAAALSAVTVFRGSKRMIVHNDAHPAGRQASNMCHELSHAVLIHAPTPALNGFGCRDWNADFEDEANFLGGALLIPAKAAWWIAKRQLDLEAAAEEYGCSTDMVHWRVNITGARRLMAG